MSIDNHAPRLAGTLLASAMLLSASLAAQAAQAPYEGGPGARRAQAQRNPAAHWSDNAHSHARTYPTNGLRMHALPVHAAPLLWRGATYWFWAGVWYAPASSGFVVVRPHYGMVVADLPAFRTLVVVDGLTYLYLNGMYYRARTEGGYEVVPSPVSGGGSATGAPGRLYIYPSQGQTAEAQSNDEYECHRWAASQSGFDPAPAATGQGTGAAGRPDYVRAQTACLEGRGYSVK